MIKFDDEMTSSRKNQLKAPKYVTPAFTNDATEPQLEWWTPYFLRFRISESISQFQIGLECVIEVEGESSYTKED